MSTHALETTEADSETGIGLTVLRYLDLGVLVAALPVFVLADFPILGYAATAAAWLAQRGIQVLAGRRAAATGDRRAAIGVLGATMMARLWLVGLSVLAGALFGRLWLVCLSVLAAGLIEREAGLAAGVLAAALFTVFFVTLFIVKPIEEARR